MISLCDWSSEVFSSEPHAAADQSFPDLKGQAPLRLCRDATLRPGEPAFPDLKGQAPLRLLPPLPVATCGEPFPDLKGQAPLRPLPPAPVPAPRSPLFLTSKVRLHCDFGDYLNKVKDQLLFLTSKVRLHCDGDTFPLRAQGYDIFS